MLVVNIPTTIHVTLKKTANFAAYALLSTFDLVIETPDKIVVYDDNITGFGSATYVTPVTANADGEITFSFTPITKGIHKITLSTGTAAAYIILGILHCSVIEPATSTVLTARLP